MPVFTFSKTIVFELSFDVAANIWERDQAIRIFYSWQNDLPPKTNRYFIKDCLEKAISRANADLAIVSATRGDLAEDIELDHDTKNVAGTPDLAATIFEKIATSDLFIADVSFVGKGIKNDKLLPNSNVLIELGHALSSLREGRVLLVMDESHGPPEKLPFDLRHKRHPMRFDSTLEDQGVEKQRFINELKDAIKLFVQNVGAVVHRSPLNPQLDLVHRVQGSTYDNRVPAIVFGIKNAGTASAKEVSATFYKSDSFAPVLMRLVNRENFPFKLDQQYAYSDSCSITSAYNHFLAPGAIQDVGEWNPEGLPKDATLVEFDCVLACDGFHDTKKISFPVPEGVRRQLNPTVRHDGEIN